MLKMLNMIDIGERAGSGIPNIYRVWHDQNWAEPTFTQSFEPDRTTLSLLLSKGDDKTVTIKSGDSDSVFGCCDTGVNKILVNVKTTTNWVNDSKHNTFLSFEIEKTGID